MSLTNQDIDISMDNVVQYANQIRMPLDSWNKETQKQILSVMEAQRIASGLNVTTFYNTLLGSTCSYKTIQHIREGTKQMPLELVLAFCYVFHYDISELINIQSEKNRAERFADYMQIGASIEALGPHIIYNAAADIANLNQEGPSSAIASSHRFCAESSERGKSQRRAKQVIRQTKRALYNPVQVWCTGFLFFNKMRLP